MRPWLQRWGDPFRLFFGLIMVGCFTIIFMSLFGVYFKFGLIELILLLFGGLLAYEAAI